MLNPKNDVGFTRLAKAFEIMEISNYNVIQSCF